jgi:predicted negative regulator of RcsB-dependent stress response
MASNNEMKPGKKKNNKNLAIAIVIILILIVGFFVYKAVTNDSAGGSSSGSYTNLQTANDDFSALEDTMNYLDTASPG